MRRHASFQVFKSFAIIFCFSLLLANGWAATNESVIHTFVPNGADAVAPYAGVVKDSAGNLYGTTLVGGRYNWGAVFELSPMQGGGWSEKLLYSFNQNGRDGYYPQGHCGHRFVRQPVWHHVQRWRIQLRNRLRVAAEARWRLGRENPL